MIYISIAAVMLAGYMLGSIPFGYIAGKMAGIDIRKHGSGNIGATNVLRVLGKKYGYTVFALDVLKGLVAVRLAMYVAERFDSMRDHPEVLGIITGALCIVGHTFSLWLKFKGGKGVATSAGAFLGLSPIPALIAFTLWVIVFKLTRYVSVASVVATISMPTSIGIFWKVGLANNPVVFYFACVLAVIVVWRHRANIVRLRQGTEPRFARK